MNEIFTVNSKDVLPTDESVTKPNRFKQWMGGIAVISVLATGAAYEVHNLVDDFQHPDFSGVSDTILQ